MSGALFESQVSKWNLVLGGKVSYLLVQLIIWGTVLVLGGCRRPVACLVQILDGLRSVTFKALSIYIGAHILCFGRLGRWGQGETDLNYVMKHI